jgi:hypothetical protein
MKKVALLFLIFLNSSAYGQHNNWFQKKQLQLQVAYSMRPINKTNSEVGFRYIDGNSDSNYLADTVATKYNLNNAYLGNAITLGFGYFVTQKIRTSLRLTPHLNSFLSNQAKNGNVYGIQFDLGMDYFHSVSERLGISFGTSVSKILGGFGITSGGPVNKEYLLVNDVALYDNDIGFHIIDNSWALSPRLGLNYKIASNLIFFTDAGFQLAFARTSKMNFAGLQKDGRLKWNSKNYGDPDINLTINNTEILKNRIDNLPYKFSGLFLDIGFKINLNNIK